MLGYGIVTVTTLHVDHAMGVDRESRDRLNGEVANKDGEGRDGEEVKEFGEGHLACEREGYDYNSLKLAPMFCVNEGNAKECKVPTTEVGGGGRGGECKRE